MIDYPELLAFLTASDETEQEQLAVELQKHYNIGNDTLSPFAFAEMHAAALDLLEDKAARVKKIKRWKRAAHSVAANSHAVNKDFQKHSKMKSD